MIYGNYLRDKYNNAAVKLADAKGYPCVFDNSKGRPLKDYKLYGKSIQDGTPTPESPVEIQSVGDYTTKNLWSFGDLGFTQHKRVVFSQPLPAGTYTVKAYVESTDTDGQYSLFKIIDTDGNVIVNIPFYFSTEKTRSFTASTMISHIDLYASNGYANGAGDYCTYTNAQIEAGSTATEYEPYHKYDIPIVVNDTTTHIYLDAPLHKVGDYADYIDFKHQKVVRNIVKRSLSVENIYEKMKNVIRFSDVANMTYGKLDYHMRSTIFRNYSEDWHIDRESIFHHPGTWYAYYWSVYWHRLGLTYDGTNVYRTDDTEQTPLTDSQIVNIAKEWLNTLSDKDREIYIILNTPTEKSTTLPALKTFKGTNIISVDTNINPSNIQVQYIEK